MIRMTRLSRPLQAGIIAAIAFATVPAVQAAPAQEVRVYVGDLRLESTAGNRQMQRRVETAIDRLCSPAGSSLLPNQRRQIRECRDSAWAGVRAQLARHGLSVPVPAQQAVSARR